jgi:hypothetical protein
MRFTGFGSGVTSLFLASACSTPVPPAVDHGVRDYRATIPLRQPSLLATAEQPKGTLMFRSSFGEFQHETFSSSGGPTLDDKTNSAKYKLQFESVNSAVGGGVQVEFTTVDDDLNNNVVGVTSADTSEFEVFGHFTAQPTGGEVFRVPIRVGPYFHTLGQDVSGTAPLDLTYMTFGVRVEVEPEVDLVSNDDMTLSLFGGARAGFGISVINFDTGLVDKDFTTTENHIGFHGGARFRIAKFNVETGYVYQMRTFNESDPEVIGTGLFVINEADFTFTGFFISAGIRW